MQRSETTSMTWPMSLLLTTTPSGFGALWNLCVKGQTISFHWPVSLNVDGVTLSNDLSIVESMNEFLSSVFTSEDCDNFPEFEYVTNSKLSNILCDTKEVEKLLKNLNIYKSPGPDSLPPRILMECASVLSSPLCFFFNKSFSTGKLPHLWKLANITPLFKKGSKTDRNNYRQVSLTLVVCKIAEKIVKSRVMDFWQNINIFNPNQFAYMEGRSTLSEILFVTTIGRNHVTTESQPTSPF